MNQRPIQFCPYCGTHIEIKEYAGKARPVCPSCGWVYFPDPKVAVGVIVTQADQILLIQRLNSPETGKWSIPAGFMDAYEEPQKAAERECREETGLEVRTDRFMELLPGREHAHGADIFILYCAHMVGGELKAGDDAGQAGFFSMDNLPPLADFRSTRRAIELWGQMQDCGGNIYEKPKNQ
jgi:8-oxo-dGTP diphosphatase